MNPSTLGGVAESQINVKMPAALKARLIAMENSTRISKSELLRALGEAACASFEEKGFFMFPVRIIATEPPPKKEKTPEKEFERTIYAQDKERIGRQITAERKARKKAS